jgi:hypothetical protein
MDKIERHTEETVKAALQPFQNIVRPRKEYLVTIVKNAHAYKSIGVNVLVFRRFSSKNNLKAFKEAKI